MQGNHQGWIAAGGAHRGKNKLCFAVRIAGNRKLNGADAYGMQPRRIVQAQKSAGNAAVGGKLRGHGGNVAACALNAAICDQFSE